LRIITGLFRGYRLSLLLLGRLVFRLLLRRLFLRCLRRFIAHSLNLARKRVGWGGYSILCRRISGLNLQISADYVLRLDVGARRAVALRRRVVRSTFDVLMAQTSAVVIASANNLSVK